jgi:glycosyltransferase involved in cell wall biosynthesis
MLRSHLHVAMRWSIGRTLARVSKEFQPDAVLAFWTDPDGTVALHHARPLGIPVGIIAGGSDLMLLPADPARRAVVAATIRSADHVFAVGSVLREKAIALGARADRVSNFIAGVDLNRFGPGNRQAARDRLGLPAEGAILLSIGSLVAVKATERLLHAAALLAREFPAVTVVVVGDGPRRSALQQDVAATPALRGRVLFAGAIDHDGLPDWYRAADLFVLPSRSEGVPNVLLEAMASGLPFVASDVGSIHDLLPFGPSRVVPEGDVPSLASAIADVLRGGAWTIPPRSFDRLAGARHLLEHLDVQPKSA